MITFNTKKEAENYLRENNITPADKNGVYSWEGTYYLHHGEYDRPAYRIRKRRSRNEYYIHVTYYYYAGTLYAPEDGALETF